MTWPYHRLDGSSASLTFGQIIDFAQNDSEIEEQVCSFDLVRHWYIAQIHLALEP
jgi:hypothetical protein